MSIPGQVDLSDLVDDEHIAGSMPAATADRDAARDAFYAQLRRRSTWRPARARHTATQESLDLGTGDRDE